VRHVKNVQDTSALLVVASRGDGSASAVRLDQVVALAVFVAVGSGSPGPNNTLLLASGLAFGFRRTVPHVVGTCLGIAILVAFAATGAGVLVTAAPRVQVAMKLVASVYLLYLGVRLAGGVALDPATASEPFTVPRATAFQFVNPKGWIFAFAVAGAFPSAGGARVVDGLTLVAIVTIIVATTAATWAVGGAWLSRTLEGDRARRVAGIVLGVVLVASVVFLWR
jgi:threonine/homoserine/homoserine lactone efflux protein